MRGPYRIGAAQFQQPEEIAHSLRPIFDLKASSTSVATTSGDLPSVSMISDAHSR